VSDVAGPATLYGEISAGGDARGNSIEPGWGWRPDSDQQTVPCQRLSPYLKARRADLLKLAIEGMEERVLTQCAGHLDQVDAIYVEVHQTDASAAHNSAGRITDLLRGAGFEVETQHRDSSHSLPASQRNWQGRVGARQS